VPIFVVESAALSSKEEPIFVVESAALSWQNKNNHKNKKRIVDPTWG
jgi:hypothetical protein